MMITMPAFFGLMMLFLPAGLNLYMFVSSLFSMGQSFYVRHIIAQEEGAKAVAADANGVIDIEPSTLSSKERRAAKRREEK